MHKNHTAGTILWITAADAKYTHRLACRLGLLPGNSHVVTCGISPPCSHHKNKVLHFLAQPIKGRMGVRTISHCGTTTTTCGELLARMHPIAAACWKVSVLATVFAESAEPLGIVETLGNALDRQLRPIRSLPTSVHTNHLKIGADRFVAELTRLRRVEHARRVPDSGTRQAWSGHG